MLSIDEIRDCLERFVDEGDVENVEKMFALLRNLVDDNNILIESRGDEIMQIVESHVNMPGLALGVRCQLNHVTINLSNLPVGVMKICANNDLVRNIVLMFSDENVHLKTQSSSIILNLLRHSATG